MYRSQLGQVMEAFRSELRGLTEDTDALEVHAGAIGRSIRATVNQGHIKREPAICEAMRNLSFRWEISVII